jgi:hypothetical protein
MRTTPSLIQTDAYNPSQTSIKLDIQWQTANHRLPQSQTRVHFEV